MHMFRKDSKGDELEGERHEEQKILIFLHFKSQKMNEFPENNENNEKN